MGLTLQKSRDGPLEQKELFLQFLTDRRIRVQTSRYQVAQLGFGDKRVPSQVMVSKYAP